MSDINKLGIGAMIQMLSGNGEAAKVIKDVIGKVITSIKLDDNKLKIKFKGGTGIQLYDAAQSCCESRYMVCDDNFKIYKGEKLINILIRNAADISDQEGECHEVQFLVIKTSRRELVISNHNEHNGYYGGFWINADKI